MRAILLSASLSTLAACQTPSGDFPTLMPRPIESRDDSITPRPAPAPTSDAATLSTITSALNEGEAAVREFDSAEPGVRAAATRAGAAGSDGWVQAQLALTTLDAARGKLTSAVSKLDSLLAAEYAAGRTPPADALTRQEALAEAATRQARAIEAIKARLPEPR